MNNYLVAALTLVTTVVLSASVLSGADRSLKAAQISSDGASAAAPILAGEKPRVPCDAEPYPNYPPLDAEPVVALWSSDELGDHWSPPACTEWPANSANKVVGLAGHFRDSRDANAMLARIGAISSLRDIRYWSVTDKQWDTLFVRARALDGPNASKPRRDFTADEVRAPGDLYFLAADNRSGEDTVWRLRIRETGERRIVIETTNVTPLRWLFLPLIAAGNMQTSYFLERETDTAWRLYSLTRVLYVLPLFGYVGQNASYTNRALAFYRHFVGIPSDRDPSP